MRKSLESKVGMALTFSIVLQNFKYYPKLLQVEFLSKTYFCTYYLSIERNLSEVVVLQ